mgnify:CR=1 FL=1
MRSKPICPICSGRTRCRFDKFDIPFHQCRKCHYGFFYPLPDKEEILARYSDTYFQTEYLASYGIQKDSYNPDLIRKYDYIENLLHRAELLKPGFKGRVLDIGCGGGFLLKNFKEKGWEVMGIDIIDSSIEYSRTVLGVDAEKVNIEAVVIDDFIARFGTFDLVIMIDALEHLFDPGDVLTRINKILAPGGSLFFSVPNIDSISFRVIGKEWAILSPFEHISYFSRQSLNILLERCGYSSIRQCVFQFVNIFNVHRKDHRRYRLAEKILPRLTRYRKMAYESRESYDDVLKLAQYQIFDPGWIQGDILIGMAAKPVSKE